jgi:hypothetical protein
VKKQQAIVPGGVSVDATAGLCCLYACIDSIDVLTVSEQPMIDHIMHIKTKTQLSSPTQVTTTRSP